MMSMMTQPSCFLRYITEYFSVPNFKIVYSFASVEGSNTIE